MKIFLTFLLSLSICFTCIAQNRAKYKIKIVEKSGKVSRGNFYMAADDGLTIIKFNRDTVKLKAENISALYISRKGVIGPLMIVGGLAFVVWSASNNNALESAVILLVGAPIGVSGGLLVGQLLANKKYYKKLEAKDFPLIKENLQKYTQIK
ncbi:hypothetical protein ACFOG5_08515 [Pedobacter fastidiosus]|uniref:Positive regulator of sigma(E), RseC/MucC n=1 Tax=Pedobacter fastidiosus TaxID=2765361 RepID=A0ABR7KPZ3_9SPHI|nr:hypothetical protein [Pedobacter fastidiosus]MBC6109807.1 hypothetical protein [Pedobacter fastidiosus]